jgi:hypothetical protein
MKTTFGTQDKELQDWLLWQIITGAQFQKCAFQLPKNLSEKKDASAWFVIH